MEGKAPQFYRIKFVHSNESGVYRWKSSKVLSQCEQVICPSRYGKDLARVLGPASRSGTSRDEELQDIVRVATEKDRSRFLRNREREAEAFAVCQEMIEQHQLDMKLVSAHYLVDEPKLLFFFTADERIDFRRLVKDLVSRFRRRIELRQIGVRDESRVLGGVAVCGRPYCCNGLTDKLRPVSIKMAKEQNLSLNSMKISGPCGRLLCCLSYEYEFYKDEKSRLPSEGARIQHAGVTYRIQEVNILSRRVRLSTQDGRSLDLPFCSFSYDDRRRKWHIVADGEE
jgi:cell fate regulator YaaT (PSP1 superfamily)